MRKSNKRIHARKRKGVMLVFVCILIFSFLILSALAVNVAYMQLVRSELRAAADAAVSATAEALSRTQDETKARNEGKAIAAANYVGGRPFVLQNSDFTFGQSRYNTTTGKYDFTAGLKPYNSVRVVCDKKASSSSGSANLFFGSLTGKSTFESTQAATACFVDRDVVLVLDRSGSMSGSRLSALKSAVYEFTKVLEESRAIEHVGVASYATSATEDQSLTSNMDNIEDAADDLVAYGWTSISSGMDAGMNIFRRGNRHYVLRTMIVMTDGHHNVGIEPRIIANQAANEGITIHTVTFGENPDSARMSEIATIGGGEYYHANSGSELKNTFKAIATALTTVVTQ
jgi:Ca-activated chloride channel homolog